MAEKKLDKIEKILLGSMVTGTTIAFVEAINNGMLEYETWLSGDYHTDLGNFGSMLGWTSLIGLIGYKFINRLYN